MIEFSKYREYPEVREFWVGAAQSVSCIESRSQTGLNRKDWADFVGGEADALTEEFLKRTKISLEGK